jgi:hypothetical protein
MAGVKAPALNRRMTLKLSNGWYANYDQLVATEIVLRERGHSMQFQDELAPVYTITHEFGHMIQNVLEKQYIDENSEEFEKVKKKSLEVGLKNPSKGKKILDDYCGKIRKQHANEIKRIILEIDPSITRQKFAECVSSYATENDAEFFAEAFANAECGKPNVIGKAITIFLERSLK